MEAEDWAGLDGDAGERYERLLVAPIFEEWAPRVLDAGGVTTGDRVLDVACGTGIVARHAIRRVGREGSVVGLDLTEPMLRVAERIEPAVEWVLGDATELPFPDESFDVVVSQAGLMFFPDRIQAVSEMGRVLVSGGRLAIQVWAASVAQQAFAAVVERHAGAEMAEHYLAPWSMPDPDQLARVVTEAGFSDVSARTEDGTSLFASLDAFLATGTAVLLKDLSDPEALIADVAEAFAPYRTADGEYHIPQPGNIAVATKI